MLYNLLEIVPGNGGSVLGQEQSASNWYFTNFGEAALYAIIGFLVVFLGIALIIAIIWLVGLVMRKTNNLEFLSNPKKGEKKNKTAKASSKTSGTAEDSDDIPDEVKAAIIAAIMAYYEEKQESCQFTVKKIKRI